jgi:tetratricopeptide (TPR) repeat protein
MNFHPNLAPMMRCALLALAVALGACAGRLPQVPAAPTNPAVVHYEMEPMAIEATRNTDGVTIESFDAEELFEQGGAALSDGRHDEAIRFYDRLLVKFPTSHYARSALYNRGLAQTERKEWQKAIDSFRELAEKYGDHTDAKDALFQLGACFAELENWPASIEIFVRLLDRKDLTADDRIEAIARRGFAQFRLHDLDQAERTFRSALAFREQIETQERLATDFFLAFSQYHLGQISHERFRLSPIRLPEAQMDRDLEEKAGLLLKAQRAYIDTIRYGNPGWASAAGFQVGSLYEELYQAFVAAPVPPELDREARDVYVEELHKKIRILLEKSMRWYRENLLMVERLGVQTDWAEKTKLSYGKLLKLLDPAAKDLFVPGDPGAKPTSPTEPTTPERPSPSRRPDRPTRPTIERQIL